MTVATQDQAPRRPQPLIQHAQAEDFWVYRPAGFIARWYAMTLDITFSTPLNLIVHLPFERSLERLRAYGHTTEYYLLTALLTAIPLMLYFVVPTLIWGQTLGKRIVGLRVIRQDGGTRLGFVQVLVRETFGRFVSAALFGIGFLMAAAEPRKRALHDCIAKTDVVGHKAKSALPTAKHGDNDQV